MVHCQQLTFVRLIKILKSKIHHGQITQILSKSCLQFFKTSKIKLPFLCNFTSLGWSKLKWEIILLGTSSEFYKVYMGISTLRSTATNTMHLFWLIIQTGCSLGHP